MAEQIRLELEQSLQDYQSAVLDVEISGQELIIETELSRPDEFYAALGAIHGAIAEIEPAVDLVTIADVTGQRITVEMSLLLACYEGRITSREFMDTWVVINP